MSLPQCEVFPCLRQQNIFGHQSITYWTPDRSIVWSIEIMVYDDQAFSNPNAYLVYENNK